MTTYHWIGGSSTSFNDPNNWNPSGVPGAADTALIDLAGTYTVISSTSNTVTQLAVEAHATLDITAGAFTVTGGSGTGGFAGTIVVADAAELSLGGVIVNSGTISEQAGADATRIVLNTTLVTLQGGGKVLLSASGNNYIYGNAGNYTLNNVNNTIAGAGNLGDGQMTLTNAAKGTIDANQSTAALTVNTGANTIVDQGLMEATAGGNLVLASAVNATGGTIEATGSGSVVTIASSLVGGTLVQTGGGRIVTSGGNTQLDGQGSHPVTVSGDLVVADNTFLYIAGTINNTGTISLGSTGDNTQMVVDSGTAELTGGGQVQLSNFANNRIYATNGGFTLLNLNNTISGAGQLGSNQLKFVNQGTVNANQTTALTLQTSFPSSNSGLIEDTGTGGLQIVGTTLGNAGGTVLASGSGAIVGLNNSSIQGGTVSTASGGLIVNEGNSSLDGYSLGAVTLAGTLALSDNTTFHLYGSIDNTGTIQVNTASNSTSTNLIMGTQVTTLFGGGTIAMSNFANNRIYADNGAEQLVNVDNTIVGAGQFGLNQLTFINDAAGVVDANQLAALVFQSNNATNFGTLESTGTASLNGGLVITGTTVFNAGGTIEALGVQAHVDLTNNATIVGGLVTTTGGGVIDTTGTGALDGMDDGTLTNAGTVQVNDNTSLYLYGTINNTGTLAMAGVTNATVTNMIVGSSTVDLTGGGQVTLSNDTGNRIYGVNGNVELVNVNNTISGSGQIGLNQLQFINEAGGVINANQPVGRTVSGQLIFQTSYVATNLGLMESTNTGGLVIESSIFNAGGTILASGAGAVVDLTNNATIFGGTLNTASGGTIQTTGSAALDGTSDGALTNAGLFQVNDGTNLTLYGTINNTGTIFEDAVSPNVSTNIILNAQVVTLTGGGELLMSNNGNNRLYGSNGSLALNNVNDTITGAGQIGVGQMQLTNSGKIIASDSTALTLAMGSGGNLTNAAGGLLLGQGTGGLVIANGIVYNAGTVEATNGSSVTYQSGVTNVNNADGELYGGTWQAVASGQGATISLDGGNITTLSASVILSGVGSVLQSGNGSTFTVLENTLTTISSTGTLTLSNARGYASTLAITDNGHISSSGGTFAAGSLTVGAGGVFTGFGILAAPLTNNGTVEAVSKLLRIANAVSGTGILEIGNKATLELSKANSEQVKFLSGKETLKLDSPGTMTGQITGLALGDTIDFSKLTVTSATVSGSTLTVDVTSGGPFTFQVAGALTGNHFAIQSDGSGGSDIVLTAGTASADFAGYLSAIGQQGMLAALTQGAGLGAGLTQPPSVAPGASPSDWVPAAPPMVAFTHAIG